MMRKIVLVLIVVLVVTGVASAADISSGLTGLWRFQTSADKLKATVGNDLTTSHPDNSYWYPSPWTVINPGLSDGGCVQERSWDYLTVNHGIAANGGGQGWNPDTWELDPAGIYFVNEYTVAMDYVQTTGVGTSWDSLFQTSWGGNDNDGDLWVSPDGTIGVGDVGYSTETYDPSTWHRIVLSVDNGNFFRVFVDGVLFLDGAGQDIDGRFALYTEQFHLFADDSWEDQWGLVSTVAVWDHALTNADVASMGDTTTALTIPEPATMSLLAIGGLALLRRNRK
jgi:hypothetical protein